MGRLLLAISFLLFSSPIWAASDWWNADGLTGGGDALDNVYEDSGAHAIAVGDFAIAVDDTYGLCFYELTNNGGAESEPWVIDPDNASAGANWRWELIDTLSLNRSTSPQSIFRDSDCTDSDDNVYWQVNCTATGPGDDADVDLREDCDIGLYQQVAGVATLVLNLDADGGMAFGSETFAYTASGDLTITKAVVLLDGDNDGTAETLDLQNGSQTGQKVHLIAAVDIDATGPDTCTIAMTDTTCTNCPAIAFDKIGENATLIWTGTTWVVTGLQSSL